MLSRWPQDLRSQWVTRESGHEQIDLPVDDGLAELIQPVIRHQTEDGRVLLASSVEYLNQCLSAESTVWDDESFEQAMRGLPTKGNSLSYVSAAFAEQLVEIGKTMVTMSSGRQEMPEGFEALIAELLPLVGMSESHPEASVLVNQKDGILITQNSASSGKHALAIGMWSTVGAILTPVFSFQNTQEDFSEVELLERELEVEKLRLEIELLKQKLNASEGQLPVTPE